MNGQAFSPKSCKSGKCHHHQLKCFLSVLAEASDWAPSTVHENKNQLCVNYLVCQWEERTLTSWGIFLINFLQNVMTEFWLVQYFSECHDNFFFFERYFLVACYIYAVYNTTLQVAFLADEGAWHFLKMCVGQWCVGVGNHCLFYSLWVSVDLYEIRACFFSPANSHANPHFSSLFVTCV